MMAHCAQDSDQEEVLAAEQLNLADGNATSNEDSSRTSGDLEPARDSHENTYPRVPEVIVGEKHVGVGMRGKNQKESDNENVDDDKEFQKLDENEAPSQPALPRTRIGRKAHILGGDFIDQADWQVTVLEENPESKFVMAVNNDSGGKEQVTLYSPYIQKVFRAVIRYL
jgi:hypothetical protein